MQIKLFYFNIVATQVQEFCCGSLPNSQSYWGNDIMGSQCSTLRRGKIKEEECYKIDQKKDEVFMKVESGENSPSVQKSQCLQEEVRALKEITVEETVTRQDDETQRFTEKSSTLPHVVEVYTPRWDLQHFCSDTETVFLCVHKYTNTIDCIYVIYINKSVKHRCFCHLSVLASLKHMSLLQPSVRRKVSTS